MMDRTGMGVQGVSGVPTQGVGVGGVTPATSNWLMVPRCTYKFEKCQGGMKVTCVCDDQMARSMLQNLCTALMGGMCSYTCTLNGMTVCCCNLTMGMCKCEVTDTRLLRDLHLRRQQVLRDDPVVLRLPRAHVQRRLHLLPDDEQHPRLLRLQRVVQHDHDQDQALSALVRVRVRFLQPLARRQGL